MPVPSSRGLSMALYTILTIDPLANETQEYTVEAAYFVEDQSLLYFKDMEHTAVAAFPTGLVTLVSRVDAVQPVETS